jgi:hypothetical protein
VIRVTKHNHGKSYLVTVDSLNGTRVMQRPVPSLNVDEVVVFSRGGKDRVHLGSGVDLPVIYMTVTTKDR